MLNRRAVAVFVALLAAGPARATTYLPVTFTDLVTRADVIFVGDVVDVRPFPLQTREGMVIKTRVIFRVSDAISGTSSTLEVFDFLGGEWDGVGMAIAGMPTFTVGDRRVVFARRERSINPIVGFTQGLLKVFRDDAGVDRVFTADGAPLARPESLGTARVAGGAPAAPMLLSEFRDRVSRARAEVKR